MARRAMIKLPGFKGVDDSGGNFHIPAGDYAMKCVDVTEEVAKSSSNDMVVFRFLGLERQAKGRQFRQHCTYGANALWKLKQTLRALGIEVPDDPSEFDPEEAIDVTVIGTVIDSEYNGKINSRLGEIRSAEDIKEEEAPAKKADNSKKKQPKLNASEVENMEEDELVNLNEERDLGVDLDAHKTTRRKQNAIIAALQANKQLEA